MKRTLQTLLLALVALPMLAQAEEQDNRLYLTVGEITENRQVELSPHLVNPSKSLTAVELYLTLPSLLAHAQKDYNSDETGNYCRPAIEKFPLSVSQKVFLHFF